MLTTEQKKLVKDNMNIVYKIATELNVLGNKDAIQEGFMGLCKASINYDKNKSKFSTFAYSYIKGYMKTFLRNDFIIKPTNVGGKLNYCNVDKYDNTLLKVEDNSYKDKMNIREIIAGANGISRIILQLYYEGYTQKDIGDKLRLSQASVSRKIKNIMKELL